MILLFFAPSLAATLAVDPADVSAYATIQTAIDAAASGDTITVVAGPYVECLDTSGKDLTVLGAGSATTSVACDAYTTYYLPTVTIDGGESVNITGFTLTNPRANIVRVESSAVVLDDIAMADTYAASRPCERLGRRRQAAATVVQGRGLRRRRGTQPPDSPD